MIKNGKNEFGAQLIETEFGKDAAIYKDAKATRSRLEKGCSVGDGTVVFESVIGEKVSVNRRCSVSSSEIAYGTYINHNTTIRDAVIGKYCSISWNVSIGGKDHDYRNAATYPAYWWKKTFNYAEELKQSEYPKCRIGNDVWIGSGAIILRKVSVGDGAVIGAGAVVTKDVEPYSVVVGNPAVEVCKRFDEDVIRDMLEIRWWDWPQEMIKKNIPHLNSKLDKENLEILKREAELFRK